MEIDSVLVEGGGILNESLIKNDCVHKVYAYIAPKLFGGEKAKNTCRRQRDRKDPRSFGI